MLLMRMATASPPSAPSTATGRQTSWPPRIDGVIIGPQQPGVEFHTMWPPSATGPSIGTSGPSSPSVNVSTKTVRRAAWVVTGTSWMAIWLLSTAGDGDEQRDLLAGAQRPRALRVLA